MRSLKFLKQSWLKLLFLSRKKKDRKSFQQNEKKWYAKIVKENDVRGSKMSNQKEE